MTAVAFDTLKLAQTLRAKANFTPEQAEGISEALSQAIAGDLATRADLADLATKADVFALKADLSALRAELNGDLSALRADLKGDLAALKDELKGDLFALKDDVKGDLFAFKDEVRGNFSGVKDELRRLEGKIDSSKTEALRWIVGAIGFQTIAVMATVFGLVRFFVR